MKLEELEKEHKEFNDQFYDKVGKWGLDEVTKICDKHNVWMENLGCKYQAMVYTEDDKFIK